MDRMRDRGLQANYRPIDERSIYERSASRSSELDERPAVCPFTDSWYARISTVVLNRNNCQHAILPGDRRFPKAEIGLKLFQIAYSISEVMIQGSCRYDERPTH